MGFCSERIFGLKCIQFFDYYLQVLVLVVVPRNFFFQVAEIAGQIKLTKVVDNQHIMGYHCKVLCV